MFKFIPSTKNVSLRAAFHPATSPTSRGTICLFSGRTEYMEKYGEIISELLAKGFAVASMDWRGQGGSSRETDTPLKGHIADYVDYDADLAAFMGEVAIQNLPKPYFALAHSMGGLILLRAAIQNVPWFERYLFSAPFVDIGTGAAPAKIISKVMHWLKLDLNYLPSIPTYPSYKIPFKNNTLTSDEARFNTGAELAKTRQELFIGAPTAGWIYQSIKAFNAVQAAPVSAFKKPMFFSISGKDKIVSSDVTFALAKRINASYIVVENAEHEVLMERDALRAQFWAGFDNFMKDIK